MAYTKEQLDKMSEILVTNIVNSMDEDSLREHLYTLMLDNMSHLGEEDVMNELHNWYDDEDEVQSVIDKATVS